MHSFKNRKAYDDSGKLICPGRRLCRMTNGFRSNTWPCDITFSDINRHTVCVTRVLIVRNGFVDKDNITHRTSPGVYHGGALSFEE